MKHQFKNVWVEVEDNTVPLTQHLWEHFQVSSGPCQYLTVACR